MQWETQSGLVAYPDALARMQQQVAAMRAGTADELAWLVEHPPLYTAGTSAKGVDLLGGTGFPVYETGRGGQYTYHGPGQRVAYLMLDLKRREADVRAYVQLLEAWIIATLAQFDVKGMVREGRVGVWVETPRGEAKIAALGVRVQGWVTSHGIALNVNPELSHYAGIVPCGIREYGVTSLHALGIPATMAQVDAVLKSQFQRIAGDARALATA